MRLPRSSGLRVVALWLGVAVFFSAENVLVGAARHRAFDWQWDVYHELVYALTWAAFSLVVLAAGRRWRLGNGSFAETIAPHLLLMAVLAPAQIVTTYTVHYLGLVILGEHPTVSLWPFLANLQGGIVWGALTGSLYYWLILGVQAAFVYQHMYREQSAATARLERSLAETRLEALRLQLHPHFLFNTLNAISAFVPADPERAQRMIARLGELLRRTLDGGRAGELPLADELELLSPYLEIQRIRFGDRLSIEVEVSDEAGQGLIPTLMLQPLVENAVEHGVNQTLNRGHVRLKAEVAGDRLRVEVSDNGPGLNGARDGIGHANTRARLRELYGESHRFALQTGASGGTAVTIELPFRREA
jgi:two-component system, LytTR family, sensor kinase